MTLTTLDGVPALVVIDMQKGIVAAPTAHPVSEVIDRISRLAQSFRKRELPVILVNVAGRAPGRTDLTFNLKPSSDWAELIPELGQQPSDYTVTKLQWGAFYGTGLDQILRRRNATQIILTGIATSIGVESTARNAYDHGYNVVPVTDSMTDFNKEAHDHSVANILPRLGQVAKADDIINLLAG